MYLPDVPRKSWVIWDSRLSLECIDLGSHNTLDAVRWHVVFQNPRPSKP